MALFHPDVFTKEGPERRWTEAEGKWLRDRLLEHHRNPKDFPLFGLLRTVNCTTSELRRYRERLVEGKPIINGWPVMEERVPFSHLEERELTWDAARARGKMSASPRGESGEEADPKSAGNAELRTVESIRDSKDAPHSARLKAAQLSRQFKDQEKEEKRRGLRKPLTRGEAREQLRAIFDCLGIAFCQAELTLYAADPDPIIDQTEDVVRAASGDEGEDEVS